MFGHLRMSPLFRTLSAALEQGWLVEVLRVMDKPSFGSGAKARDNLTVAKCHELFQADPTPTAAEKADEQAKFTTVTDTYDKANLQGIRNRDMFHLDLIDAQQPPRPTGDVEKLTRQLTEWFLTVAPLHYRRSLDVTFHMRTIRNRGRLLGRYYRRMMMSYYRTELGRPSRRRARPTDITNLSHWGRYPSELDEKKK